LDFVRKVKITFFFVFWKRQEAFFNNLLERLRDYEDDVLRFMAGRLDTHSRGAIISWVPGLVGVKYQGCAWGVRCS
jgi:hypothetical protein